MRRFAALASAALALAIVAVAEAAVPVNQGLPQMSGGSTAGATVTTTTGSWSESPTAYEFRWWRCVPSGGGGCTPSAVATTQAYTLTDQDVGAKVYPAVRAQNASGWSQWQTGYGVTVTAAGTPVAPTMVTRPHVTGEPVVGATLTATPGTWTPAPEEYRYQWGRCVVATGGSSCTLTEIPGATGSTYVVTAEDSGAVLRPKVAARAGSTWSAYAPSDNYVGPIGGGLPPSDWGDGEGDYGAEEGDYGAEEGDYGAEEGDYGDETDGSATTARPTVRNTGWAASTSRTGAKIVVKPAVRVVCPARVESCSLELLAKVRLRTGKSVTIARARRTVRASSRTVVAFTLNAAGRRLLRQRRQVSATVTVTARAGDGDPVVLTKRIPIRRPA